MTVKQYKTVDGIRKHNQAYVPTATAVPVPFTNGSTALAVVSAPSPDDEEIVVTPLYAEAVTQYHDVVEPEIFVGIDANDDQQGAKAAHHGGLEQLNEVMAKYEVPAGMLSKLLELSRFDAAEIIVDDSGSMRLPTDAKGPRGESLTRWWEAKWRISQMIELMAYVICPPITICFLNRADVLQLQRNAGESPAAFIERAESMLMATFAVDPAGTTPAREAIDASLRRHAAPVLRYFLGDGVPNGGPQACRDIENMLIHRPNPERSPFTFMSCTGNDADVEWMKECEERAPFCSEFDDYGDESREILKDQGKAFPYSFGLHLVAQIVGAFNPNDLDAMDESVPFTRRTLSDLLGYQSNPQEYRYYFDSFLAAQRRLSLRPFQRTFVNKLPSLYGQFESASGAATAIPDVVEYKRQMKYYGSSAVGAVSRSAQPAQDECCIIL